MPQRKKANEARFVFICGTINITTFEVISFEGTDQISHPYEFDIKLISSNHEISGDQVVNKPGSLFIYRNGEYFPYSGVVTEFHFLDKNEDHSTYSVHLVPTLWLLSLTIQTKVFQRKKIIDIIKEVLQANAISDVTVDCTTANYPDQEFVVQYNESDLHFISRLMEAGGIWYFFKEHPLLEEEIDAGHTKEKLIITDKPAKFEYISGESTIMYRSKSGLNERVDDANKESVNRLQYDRRVKPTEASVKNYNYRTPEVDLTGKKPISTGDIGKVYKYGGDFKDSSGAQHAAEVLAHRIVADQITVDGDSNCGALRAGWRYTLTDHLRTDLNTNYVVTKVEHAGAHSHGTETWQFTYQNKFGAIPGSQISNYAPAIETEIPRVNGVITATIEASGSDYASLDDRGRYKVRLPFDVSSVQNYEASKYVRLAQPYAGSNYGMHFPSHEGTEMIIGCIDGDPNRPIGLGTVPNANTTSPVVSRNKAQNVIKTAGGNQLTMDDTDGKQKITIKSNSGHTVLQDDENKLIKIISKDQNALLIDDKNKLVSWNADTHKITMCYDSDKGITIKTGGKHLIKIDDTNKIITIKTNGGHQIDMDDSGKKIILKDGQGKNTVTLDGNGGLILESEGKIEITAKQDLVIKAANIKMTADAAIEAKATSDIKLKGANLEAKADSNAKIEGGMNLDLKAGMQCNVKGTMLACAGDSTAEFKGGMMTTIKGTMVMIN